MDKYTTAIELFNSCVDARTDEIMINARFNELLQYLHANFDKPESTPEILAEYFSILHREVPIENILCNPPKVSDAAFPVALAKIMLTEYQAPLIGSNIPQFNTFHSRYGKLIIQSMM